MNRMIYSTVLSGEEWAFLSELIPPVKTGGRPRTTDIRLAKGVEKALKWLFRHPLNFTIPSDKNLECRIQNVKLPDLAASRFEFSERLAENPQKTVWKLEPDLKSDWIKRLNADKFH